MGKPEITEYVSFEWIGLTTCELEILIRSYTAYKLEQNQSK